MHVDKVKLSYYPNSLHVCESVKWDMELFCADNKLRLIIHNYLHNKISIVFMLVQKKTTSSLQHFSMNVFKMLYKKIGNAVPSVLCQVFFLDFWEHWFASNAKDHFWTKTVVSENCCDQKQHWWDQWSKTVKLEPENQNK